MPALPPSTSGRLRRARPHLLLLLLLLTAFLATATSASAINHRHMQAAATEEDVAITVDYDRSHGYDVGGPAPICWKRINATQNRLAACPPELILNFNDALPNPLFSMRNYTAFFRVIVNREALGLSSLHSAQTQLSHEIYHANVHSCVASVGFCSPAIGNTPGLSTHSPEKRLNFTPIATKPGWSTALISNPVRLDPGTYTIIAHIFLLAREGSQLVRWSVAQAVTREVLPPKHFLAIAPAITYAMGAMVALTVVFLLLNLVALLYYRKHKIMKFSQGNILQAMTLAGIIAVGSLPLAAVSSTPSCLLRPWLQIIPLNFLFGLLFGKTWRIHRLLNNKQLKAIKVKESAVFFVAFLLTLPEIAIHGLYFLLAPPSLSEKNVLNEFTFVDICASDPSYKRVFDGLHLAYGAFILILGCYVAQKSAALTTLFNEGTYILFAIYTCSILAVIIVPATFAVASSPQTAYVLRVLGVSLAVAGTIGAIILPKLLLIRSGLEMSLEDNKTTAGNKTMAGSAKTSSNASSGGKDGGSLTTSIPVKNHVPTSVFTKMQDAFNAVKKLKDRQEQGYAIVPAEWKECVDEVKGLMDVFERCVVETGGGAGGAGGEGKDKGSARVAPLS